MNHGVAEGVRLVVAQRNKAQSLFKRFAFGSLPAVAVLKRSGLRDVLAWTQV